MRLLLCAILLATLAGCYDDGRQRGYREGYEAGQKDAALGFWSWRLVEDGDTKRWEPVTPKASQ